MLGVASIQVGIICEERRYGKSIFISNPSDEKILLEVTLNRENQYLFVPILPQAPSNRFQNPSKCHEKVGKVSEDIVCVATGWAGMGTSIAIAPIGKVSRGRISTPAGFLALNCYVSCVLFSIYICMNKIKMKVL